jgi:predicted secreted hydrolase
MLYRLRTRDGGRDPHSSGTWKGSRGGSAGLRLEDFALDPLRIWHSQSGGAYPVEWKVRVPGQGLDLEVRAVMDNQELRTSRSAGIVYWEGAIEASGKRWGRPVKGRGYLEMTGYAGPPLSALVPKLD